MGRMQVLSNFHDGMAEFLNPANIIREEQQETKQKL